MQFVISLMPIFLKNSFEYPNLHCNITENFKFWGATLLINKIPDSITHILLTKNLFCVNGTKPLFSSSETNFHIHLFKKHISAFFYYKPD